MKFLGLRLCEHDSNISFADGKDVKYYKSERDYQIKHHGFCDLSQWSLILDRWNIDPKDVDAIGIVIDSFKHPYLNINEKNLYDKIDIPLFKDLGFTCPVYRIDHHFAHTLSIWPLKKNVDRHFVFDGFGDEYITHSLFQGWEREKYYNDQEAPSFGKILSEFGALYGLSGSQYDMAGKVMALKAYSKMTTEERQINKKTASRFNIQFLDKLWDKNILNELKTDQDKIDFISMSHEITEDIFAQYFSENCDDVVSYSGGVAQNVVINEKIKRKVKDVIIPPHCNDEGLSLGIIEFLRIHYEQEKFERTQFPFWQDDEAPNSRPSLETIKATAKYLADGKIVAWYQGHGEVGPRALGNRSILLNPSLRNGKDLINRRVKNREWFRPFGASVLLEEVSNYFEWEGESPYMLFAVDVKDKKRFPAITHADGTCRIQTVSNQLEDYHRLIKEFSNITGIPMLLNTSLNVGGKPIAGRISNALELFHSKDIDVLVVGDEICT